ncbi:large subunit ribosomal protein L29 [Marchantia polymorpha subsp. ruderalis]|uniref:Large ribosomal subunit protein uL29c n=2 Tax=Marchantia polymorpha TaxID=3197 RepID=A0A176WH53_MARPO|nr:hypothetical protein AXG93_4485s1200 [Marchantia polymorpha subsp. ruderalis]PTQ46327.1 hypothetical protein MARPO_0011s0026 [Marchantia polymorpha]BBN08291.1 hypothetical protein Mp_4g10390 [Marchantia polymorpha subsp. ruderalis]|eukprot:PTQ46327.1 hypothetical protein MARPO_0011s0026 [Marchantia polymorpha]
MAATSFAMDLSSPSLSRIVNVKQVSSSCNGFNARSRIQMPSLAAGIKCRSLEISAMAKRQEELVDIRKMSDEDIGTSVVELKGELFVLRCKQATRQDYKSSEFRRIRKQIARMLTVRRERELEKGINMRESRKLDREWKKNVVIKPPASLASLVKAE